MKQIKILSAALDERDGKYTLRGVIDPESLKELLVDESYQREVLGSRTIKDIANALRAGQGVPDAQLGMRGGNFIEKKGTNVFYLTDPVYIVDGLQRTTAAQKLLAEGLSPNLGVTIYFNTTQPIEKVMFKNLNTSRTQLSPNVLLNNERSESVTVELLYSLCKDNSFCLKDRVSWKQKMRRDHLIGASGMVKVVSLLHSRFTSFGDDSSNALRMAKRLDKMTDKLRRQVVRDNCKLFFNTVDEMYNLQGVTYREAATHLRRGFLNTLARVFANHKDFWDDTRLVIPPALKKKLAGFPINDPSVRNLAGAGDASRNILYFMVVEYINSSKRTKRLTPFVKQVTPGTELEMEEDEEEMLIGT